MHAFRQNAISFGLLYSGFVFCNIQVLYKKSAVYLSDCRVMIVWKIWEMKTLTKMRNIQWQTTVTYITAYARKKNNRFRGTALELSVGNQPRNLNQFHSGKTFKIILHIYTILSFITGRSMIGQGSKTVIRQSWKTDKLAWLHFQSLLLTQMSTGTVTWQLICRL